MHKLTSLTLLIGLFIAHTNWAQYAISDLEINNESSSDAVGDFLEIIGEIDNVLYYRSCLGNEVYVVGVSQSTNKQLYRESLFTSTNNQKDFNSVLMAQGVLNNTIVNVYTEQDQNDQLIYKVKSFDKTLKKRLDARTLYTVEPSVEKISSEIKVEADKITIRRVGKYVENKARSVHYMEFDIQLNKTKNIEFDLALDNKKYHISEIYFDAMDNMFASIYWDEIDQRKSKSGFDLQIGRLERTQKWQNERLIVYVDKKNKKIVPLHSHTYLGLDKDYSPTVPFLDHQGRFCLAQGYSDNLTKNSNSGIAFYIFNTTTMSFDKTEVPFDAAFKEKYFNTRFAKQAVNKIRNNTAINDLDLMNVLLTTNGGFQCIFEIRERGSYPEYSKDHKTIIGTNYTLQADDIAILQFNASYGYEWNAWIEKKQHAVNRQSHLSYSQFQADGQLIIIYNDTPENYEDESGKGKNKIQTYEAGYDCVWACCIIDENGKVKKGIYTPPPTCYPSLMMDNNCNRTCAYMSTKNKRYFGLTFLVGYTINVVSFKLDE
jgi:hypothetical protein